MDPNENLNARFSIVRAWQGYTVTRVVLCIQTIFSFFLFLSFSLFLFHFLFSLEPRVKTRRLAFRNCAWFTIVKTIEWREIIRWEHEPSIKEISFRRRPCSDLIFVTFFSYLHFLDFSFFLFHSINDSRWKTYFFNHKVLLELSIIYCKK